MKGKRRRKRKNKDICRICLEAELHFKIKDSDRAEQGPSIHPLIAEKSQLISPCECSGSMKYIHRYCLEKCVLYRNNSGQPISTLHRPPTRNEFLDMIGLASVSQTVEQVIDQSNPGGVLDSFFEPAISLRTEVVNNETWDE